MYYTCEYSMILFLHQQRWFHTVFEQMCCGCAMATNLLTSINKSSIISLGLAAILFKKLQYRTWNGLFWIWIKKRSKNAAGLLSNKYHTHPVIHILLKLQKYCTVLQNRLNISNEYLTHIKFQISWTSHLIESIFCITKQGTFCLTV